MDADLHTYLHTRSIQELRLLQRALNCRIDGKKSRRRDLIDSIMAHAARYGLTRAQAHAFFATIA